MSVYSPTAKSNSWISTGKQCCSSQTGVNATWLGITSLPSRESIA
jgi:hypothetical protein